MIRTAMKEFDEWKRNGHKPLLILGARQTGKTWLMKQFGKENYPSVAYIELKDTEQFREMFKNVTDPERIFRLIEVCTSQKIDPGNTLVILDEIQEVPQALSALKFIQEKAPDYHVMAACSYLRTNPVSGLSFPVGKVEILRLRPMNFCEFLTACGSERFAKLIQDRNLEDCSVFQTELEDMLKLYCFVGGMPESVSEYVRTGDLGAVRKVQKNLLDLYRSDFSKHIPPNEIARVNMVWDSIPSQLAKENKKFVYRNLKQGARASEFESAIQWLVDMGLLDQVYRLEKPGIPLAACRDMKAFKLYMTDIGLLGAMADIRPETIVDGSILFSALNGSLGEQFVLQELRNQTDQIYYWSSLKSTGEVEFVIGSGNKVWPVEVKSGKNVQSKRLKAFLDKYDLKKGIRFSLLPYKKQDSLVNYPLYFAGELFELIGASWKSFMVKLPDDSE